VIPKVPVNPARIRAFCRQWKIAELSLFGSVLRDDFGPQSDVDVLVTFAPQDIPDFFDLHAMQQELSGIFGGRRVDLVTRKSLSPLIQSRVLAQAQVQYAT
jgi:predicted nucleotidyltransferase